MNGECITWINLMTHPLNGYLLYVSCVFTFDRWNRAKLTLAQRKDRVAQKKASFLRAQAVEED